MLAVAHAFDGVVVEVDVGHLDFRRKRVGIDGESVVLRGDRDFSGAQVLDRLVAAAVAEFQLKGGAAEGVGEDLVAEADAKNRELADERADFLVDVAERGRIAGAVGEEDAVGIFREHFGGGGAGIDDLNLETGLAEAAEDVVFQPEIVGDDAVADGRKFDVIAFLVRQHVGQRPFAGFLGPDVGFGSGNLLHVVHAFHRRRGFGRGDGGFRVEHGGDAGAHGA